VKKPDSIKTISQLDDNVMRRYQASVIEALEEKGASCVDIVNIGMSMILTGIDQMRLLNVQEETILEILAGGQQMLECAMFTDKEISEGNNEIH
jgi:hypothetical protein